MEAIYTQIECLVVEEHIIWINPDVPGLTNSQI